MKRATTEKYIFHLSIDVEKFYESFDFARDLKTSRTTKEITVFDEYKNKHEAKISSAAPDQFCYWDRHPFAWKGICCPLRKEYEPILKVYKSNINDSTYSIQDSINTTKNTYISEDYFCSPECVLAYIEDNSTNPKFIDSKELLFEIIGKEVLPAGSWRLLKPYGGIMSIDEFRRSFRNKSFELEAIVFKPEFFIYKESYHL